MKRWFLLIALFLAAGAFAQAQSFYPGAKYNPKVPAPESVLGYKTGDYFTDHYQMEIYIHKLAEAVPERVQVIPTGQSVERRHTYVVLISSPENMQKLEAHRLAIARLRDPRKTTVAEARKIAATTPVFAYMNYANDGNESAAFEACLQVAYHFAAGEDAGTRAILHNAIIVLNPAHNPESHQRYVAWMKASVVGPHGTADPFAAEHNGDWRMSTNNNHYQIDLNRDAFALSQVESQIAAAQLHRWHPQVFVDHHGETNEYFFAPYAIPVNMNLPPTTKKWADVIGRNNATAFDQFGWSYFSREVFDLHYPGYWDSYPSLNGAIGMTYETDGGGRKGLQFERPDKTILRFRDGIQHHVVASITTIKTAAENREKLLLDYYAFFKNGMEEARSERIKQVVLLPGEDPGRLADLVELLQRHQIEVYKTGASFTATALDYLSGKTRRRNIPAGAVIVPFAQPQKRLAKTLLETDAKMEEAFVREARASYDYNHAVGEKAPKERLGFYDVTAWSLPLAFGIDACGLERPYTGQMQRLEGRPPVPSGVVAANGPAAYAYAFSYTSNNGAKLLARLLREDYKLAISRRPFKADGTSFPRGTVIARVERNPASLHMRIKELASACEVQVYPMRSAWTEKGVLLGSNHVINLKKPKVAVITEEPVRQTSYGAIWYTLEQRYSYPFTAIRLAYFKRIDLYKYNVLVMPPGSAAEYARMLGEAGIKRIKEWVHNGGVFVGIKDGAAFAAREKVGLTTARLVGAPPARKPEGKMASGSKAATATQEKAATDQEKKPDFTPGAILKVKLDTHHFMSLGYGEFIPVLVQSNYLFKPSKEGANVGTFVDKGGRLSGFIWEKTEKMFPGKAYLIHEPTGRGKVILFADEPLFRLFWRGLDRLFLNSILLAPSF